MLFGHRLLMLGPAFSRVHMPSAVSATFRTKPWRPVLGNLEYTFVQATAEGAALSDGKTHAIRAHCDPVSLQCTVRTGACAAAIEAHACP